MSFIDSLLGTDDEPDEPESAVDLTADECFDLLANDRRRYVIDRVGDLAPLETIGLADLAVELAEIECDAELDTDAFRRARKRCYVSLHQTHLPTLEDHGVLTYHNEQGEIQPGPAAAPTRRVLSNARHSLARELGGAA